MSNKPFLSRTDTDNWAKRHGYRFRSNLWMKPEHYLAMERLPDGTWIILLCRYGSGKAIRRITAKDAQ